MPVYEIQDSDVLPERTNYDMQIERDPTFGELSKAYFENENIVFSVANKFAQPSYEADPDYDVFSNLQGYETYADRFIGVESAAEATRIKANIDRETTNKEYMAAGGLEGVAAGILSGVTDPTMFIPIGGAAYKTYRTGGRILEGAGKTALMTGVVQTGNELALQSLQETRTAEESGYNIAGATFLGGILGGAAGLFSPKEFQALSKQLDDELTLNYSGSTAGAASVYNTTLDDEALKTTAGLKPLRDKAVSYLNAKDAPDSLVRMAEAVIKDPDEILSFMNPVSRMAQSPSLTARRLNEQLSENVLVKNKNVKGIASEVSVENYIKAYNLPKFQFYKTLDDYFMIHRNAKTVAGPKLADMAATTFKRSRADGKLTYSEFGEEVVKAARRDDKHEIPEVANAARQLRSQILDPLFAQAKEVGLIDEGTEAPKTAASYVSRIWDTNRIKADLPKFREINAKWLKQKRDRAVAEVDETFAQFNLNQGPIAEIVKEAKADLKAAASLTREAVKKEAKAGEKVESIKITIDQLERRLNDATKNQQRIYNKILNKRERGDDDLRDLFFEFRSVSAAKRDLYKGLMAKESDAEIKTKEYWRRERIANQLADAEKLLEERFNKLEAQLDEIETLQYKAGFDDGDLDGVAYQLVDRILGTPVGRLSYDTKLPSKRGAAAPGKRGPAKARVYDIPDEMVEEFLVNDINSVVESYVRSLASDIELTKKFGSIDPEETLKKIQDDYARLAKDATPEQALKLKKQQDADMRDFNAMWERIRGTYGNNGADDYASVPKSMERVAMTANYLAMLGGMTISALSDIARPVMVNGIKNVVGDGVGAMARDWKGFKAAAKEIQEAGTALDMVLNDRSKALAGMDEYTPFANRVEAITGKMANNFGVMSLMAPWNAGMKQFAGVVSQSRLIKLAQKSAEGKELTKAETEFLASNFMDKTMARRVAENFKAYGENVNGVLVPNARDWDDDVKEIFRAAIRKEVDRTIVTPGQDRPLLMSKSGWKLMFQFRSFAFASTQRVLLSGLQQRDAALLNGLILSTFLGMGTYALKTDAAGGELSDDPRKWIVEGVDRAGVTGIFFDANNIVEKVSRGRIGVNALLGGPAMSRYASRSAMEAVFGPTYGMLGNMTQVTGNALAGDWQEADTHTIRRMTPYQNLFYVRGLFDEAETNINDFFGVEQKTKQ